MEAPNTSSVCLEQGGMTSSCSVHVTCSMSQGIDALPLEGTTSPIIVLHVPVHFLERGGRAFIGCWLIDSR